MMTAVEYFLEKVDGLRVKRGVWLERSLHSSIDGAHLQLSVSWSPDSNASLGEVEVTLDALLNVPLPLDRYAFVEKNMGTNKHTFVGSRAYNIPEQDVVKLLSGFYNVYFDCYGPKNSRLDDGELPAKPGDVVDGLGGIVYDPHVNFEQDAVNTRYTIEAKTDYAGILDAVFKRFSEEVESIEFSVRIAGQVRQKCSGNDALEE